MIAFIIVSAILVIVLSALILVSLLVSQTSRDSEKLSSYECGLEPIGDARMKFDIIYYLVGIQFLIFDLEVIFLFPLATTLFTLSSYIGFQFVNIFLFILTIGFIYEYMNGALNVLPDLDKTY